MSERLLGLVPDEVGGASAKGSFARALTERCFDGDRLDALVDVILHSRKEVDPARPRHRRADGEGGARGRPPARRLHDPEEDRRERSRHRLSGGPDRRRGEGDLRAQGAPSRGRARSARGAPLPHREPPHRHRRPPGPAAARRGRRDRAGRLLRRVRVHRRRSRSRRASRARAPSRTTSSARSCSGILEPLAALHKAHLVHGDVKTENILVAGRPATWASRASSSSTSAPIACASARRRIERPHRPPRGLRLAEDGRARDRPRPPRRPEERRLRVRRGPLRAPHRQARLRARERDGRRVRAPLERARAAEHARAARPGVARTSTRFVLSLLNKDPARRPKDAAAVLDALESIGRASAVMRAAGAISAEKVQAMIDKLLAAPERRRGRDRAREGGRRGRRAGARRRGLRGRGRAGRAAPRAEATSRRRRRRRSSIRAARIFDSAAKDKVRAEQTYAAIVELDPSDEIAIDRARGGPQGPRQVRGARRDAPREEPGRAPGEERGRALAEIGRLYASELEDPDQAVVAFTQALCEVPTSDEYAARGRAPLRSEADRRGPRPLETITEAIKGGAARRDRACRAPRARGSLVRHEARPRRHGARRLPAGARAATRRTRPPPRA